MSPVETRARARRAVLDAACAEALDLARAAAEDLGGEPAVGEHLGVDADADRVVTHYFACNDRAYRGWRWAVTLARASRSKVVTVDETTLLPGVEAVLAPVWLPWSERLRPGDLGAGDLLPAAPDDPRLVPGWTGDDDEDVPPPGDSAGLVARELGLLRARVLSPEGRDLAAERWYDGVHGPQATVAQLAPAPCSTCGFLLRLGGPLRQVFGLCANELSPSDGQVVSYDHGCGAHSEAALPVVEVAPPVVDELLWDVLSPPAQPAHAPGSVDAAAPTEELGHS